MVIKTLNDMKEFFEITSVSREDLEQLGFDAENLSDTQMEEIASDMATDYCNQLYWGSLKIIAENRGITYKN